MAKKILIAPAMRSAKWASLGEEIKRLERAKADMLHFDASDGHFISDLSIGADTIACVKALTRLPIEVHLMVMKPENYIKKYAEAGADILIVHPESTAHIHRVLGDIRTLGKSPALSINPGTPFEAVRDVLHLADKISVMTVNPGVGGIFVESVVPKIKQISVYIKKEKLRTIIQADGGVSLRTRDTLLEAGVTSFVVGYPIFSKQDYALGVREITSGKPQA